MMAEQSKHPDSREHLRQHLEFEMLLSDISGRFINLPVDRIDSEIEGAQRRICEWLGVDLSALWQWSSESPNYIQLTNLYRPMGGPPLPARADAQEMFPWCVQQLRDGKVIVVQSMADVPKEAARDLEVWRHYGIKTSLTFPLSVGEGPLLGALSFNTTQKEHNWPSTIVKRLELIAQVFANAITRKRTEWALRESEERLRLATDAVDAGLWVMDVDTRKVWVSTKTRELFHLAPDDEIFYESFFKTIHPEDRERVRQAVNHSLRTGESLYCDFRIVLPDEGLRWVVSRGKPYLKSTGEPDRFMGISLDITERKDMEKQLQERLQEIERLKDSLQKENIYLYEEIKILGEHSEIIGQTLRMKKILSRVEQVAPTDSTVLILGETGTGKEILARAIHRMSARNTRPLVTVNCASLPPLLIESELFGREKGAYTGALTRMLGRFEIADGSTLFLDEIAEIPLELQSKLLRVLEEGTFERLGSTRTLHVDVRIIAATNRDIDKEVREGRFRKDLFYRLNVFPIEIPPLRERVDDIPLLVWNFVKEFQNRMGKRIDSIPKRSMEALQAYPWPGNIRELKNVIERAIISSNGRSLDVPMIDIICAEHTGTRDLKDMERGHILSVLEKTHWRVMGKGGAAEVLGLKRTTLQSKMKKLGIARNQTPPK